MFFNTFTIFTDKNGITFKFNRLLRKLKDHQEINAASACCVNYSACIVGIQKKNIKKKY